jgi:hypothetical protein
MPTAFVISAASAAVDVAVFLLLLAAWNRRADRREELRYLYVASAANRAHQDPPLR